MQFIFCIQFVPCFLTESPGRLTLALSGEGKLRRQDSNMRPPGYEPGELPTAPLRDINQLKPFGLKDFRSPFS